jgi:hypothetical protein
VSFTVLLLGLLSLAGAQVPVPLPTPPKPADGMVRVSFTSWDGTLEIWDIDRSRYDALPVWSPADGSAPLTLTDALKAAEAVLTLQHPAVKTWFATNTALLRDACGRAWSYRVTLRAGTYAPGTATGRFSLLVLLDGSVVEPKRYQGTPSAQNALPQQPVQDPSGAYRVGAGVVAPRVLFSLDDGAINTLQQWRFTPGTLNGTPVKVSVIVDCNSI